MEERAATPFWLWLNVLSLDSPIVALVWQDFLMRCYPALLRAPARWVLGLTVWAIYLADRLLDAQHPAADNETARHRFYRRHMRSAMGLLILVGIADGAIAILGLRPDVLLSGLFIAACVLLYLALFALWRIGVKRWKHPSAALLFTVGVFLVEWIRTADPARTLTRPAAVFCALCFGNLILIESWEQGWLAAPRVWMLMPILIAACAVLGDTRWYLAVSASAFGLAILDLSGGRMDATVRHVLADALLLTPLLFK
jgi:hypothetical protein